MVWWVNLGRGVFWGWGLQAWIPLTGWFDSQSDSLRSVTHFDHFLGGKHLGLCPIFTALSPIPPPPTAAPDIQTWGNTLIEKSINSPLSAFTMWFLTHQINPGQVCIYCLTHPFPQIPWGPGLLLPINTLRWKDGEFAENAMNMLSRVQGKLLIAAQSATYTVNSL